jgi:hypothetical protein
MSSDDLYARVLARPDDTERLKVWADGLLAEGNPRGEFIMLQLADEAGQLDEAGGARMNALQETHGKQWLSGQVLRLCERVEFRRGLPVEIWLGQRAEAQLVSADWQGITTVGFLDGQLLMEQHLPFIDALLDLELTGLKGVPSAMVPLIPDDVEELGVLADALDSGVLEALGARLHRLRSLHVQGVKRPVVGHLVCSSALAKRVERLAIDFTTFELMWRDRDVRVHVFVDDPPLLRIEAELRAGPPFAALKVVPEERLEAIRGLAQQLLTAT